MLGEGFVLFGEHPGRTDFNEIAAEFIFQCSILLPAKIQGIMRTEDVEVSPTRIVSVKSDASIALDAPVDLMTNERTKGLIAMRPLRKVVPTVSCPVMTVISCKWHSPPSSHTGQSCG